MECVVTCYVVNEKRDIILNFEIMSKKQRIKAFNLILRSIDLFQNGFDWVDGEKFENYFNKLTNEKQKEIYDTVYFDINERKFIDYFYENIEDRITCWKLMFERLNKSNQVDFLENEEEDYKLYSKTLEIINAKYDWNNFQCNLLNREETTKLRMIKETWNELGTQVYDCRLDNGSLCPCLRECSVSATMYKCFEDYLKNHELSPNSYIPIERRMN